MIAKSDGVSDRMREVKSGRFGKEERGSIGVRVSGRSRRHFENGEVISGNESGGVGSLIYK